MMGAFGGPEILIFLITYLIPIIFIIWMVTRFIQAQEKMADGIKEIARKLEDTDNI